MDFLLYGVVFAVVLGILINLISIIIGESKKATYWVAGLLLIGALLAQKKYYDSQIENLEQRLRSAITERDQIKRESTTPPKGIGRGQPIEQRNETPDTSIQRQSSQNTVSTPPVAPSTTISTMSLDRRTSNGLLVRLNQCKVLAPRLVCDLMIKAELKGVEMTLHSHQTRVIDKTGQQLHPKRQNQGLNLAGETYAPGGWLTTRLVQGIPMAASVMFDKPDYELGPLLPLLDIEVDDGAGRTVLSFRDVKLH